jgi:integrase
MRTYSSGGNVPKFTKRYLDSLQPESGPDAKDTFEWDTVTPGLGVRVYPTGRKAFVFKYQIGGRSGRSKRYTLGELGTLSLEDARKLATRDRALVYEGIDPAARRAKQKAATAAEHKAPTVAQLADDYLKECAERLKAKTVLNYRHLLGVTPVKYGPKKGTERIGELRKALGHLKVHEVTDAQVRKLLHNIGAKTGRPIQANRARSLLSGFFNYAEREGHRPHGTNPCRHARKYKERRSERFLTAEEVMRLRDVLDQAENDGLPPLPGQAPDKRRRFSKSAVLLVRFLLLRGFRKDEARLLKWENVDLDSGVVDLPDTKGGRSVRALGDAALQLLKRIDEEHRQLGNPYVFFGKVGKPIASVDDAWKAIRSVAGLEDVRMHDLRHTAGAFAAGAGMSDREIADYLGHGDVRSVQTYIHWADEQRKRNADKVTGALAALLEGTTAPKEPAASKPSPEPARVLPFRSA